ncbi:monovalent cation/H(+) antiporter subunit G [Rhodococcus sp. D2-41]|uniref:Monovalent cation/H(+) antiporter subunit G n=1 Tax=Speluncibacter jeojiensis TaxID=2710754 RepID=A0A9X4M5B5_9ACTN|nr:monovalent cation/H(+) antiporter subunit G [Rhodococcus sp. D2-41]MDG3010024.1 monovalent cation/H(+) antiporter subunit G [Rhodococcus sp. D2-41]MDG3016272.1 monovalent cation/H(+) antiporter subunit G [Corynebacteriales bacterium D3-21]
MSTTLDVVAAVLVLIGSLFALTAAIGLVRFPDTLSRMHPGTKPQVLGLVLVLIGAGLRLRDSVDLGMLVLAALFALITSPLFAHLVGRLSYREQSVRTDLMTVDEMDEPDE